MILISACSSVPGGDAVAVIDRMTGDRPAPATDRIEVWICDVPADTTAAVYGDLPLRLPLEPASVAGLVGPGIAAYFEAVSHGRYAPSVVPGDTVVMRAYETDADCVDQALDRSGDDATVVLAVATAEHAEGQPGGWGTPGSWLSCQGACPARTTRRAASVGASDFSADWGPVPLLDLMQHELGHALGLPHSSVGADGRYLSALDVMSNSAAAREITGAGRNALDAPDLLGIDRVDLGWLPLSDVVMADGTTTATLTPSTAEAGTRLLVLPVDEHRIVTVELLTPTGFHAHLPEAGIAVHLVDDSVGTDVLRSQQAQGSAPPHTDLLGTSDELVVAGWRIEVRRVDAGGTRAEVAVSRTQR
jgi:M6 family metalloprotease-like protein